MIEKSITRQEHLTEFLAELSEATRRGDQEIVAEAIVPKGSRLSKKYENSIGWTEEGLAIANVLDQKILPVPRKTCYRWRRYSEAGPRGILWRFRLVSR